MSKMTFQVNGTTLSIGNPDGSTAKCRLPWPIVQVLEFAEILVVRIEPPPGIRFNENVFGILGDASIGWQVAKRDYVYDDSPYTDLIRCEENLKLMNWDGLELLVNPMTGTEASESYGR
jgi:hypothetical protein